MPLSKIEWLRNPGDGSRGYSINPVKGLCPMHCSYCYAADIYRRFKLDTEIRFEVDALKELATVKKPSRFFIGSTMELFGPWVPDEWINTILSFVRAAERHTFLFLTKNPSRLAEVNPWPANAWVGASIDKGYRYVPTLSHLAKVEAAVKWVSFEPLMEDLYPLVCSLRESGISWAVIGGLSGRKPFYPPEAWIAGLESVLNQVGVAIFEKSNLRPRGALRQEYTPAETCGQIGATPY